jgi:hypothetical protein
VARQKDQPLRGRASRPSEKHALLDHHVRKHVEKSDIAREVDNQQRGTVPRDVSA